MPAVLIREAVAADRDSLVELNLELARETEEKQLDPVVLARGLAAALSDPRRLRYWVAVVEEEGRVVGQAATTREWSDWRNGWVWWFQSVFVRAESRGLGVFRALHERIRSEAQATPGVIGLRLYVEHANAAAMATYRALGFRDGGYLVYEDLWLRQSSTRRDQTDPG